MHLPKVIYALRHEATGKIYVGSTENPHTRILKHFNRLANGTHHVKDFQDDYDRHENKKISVTYLDVINDFSERDKEYMWMNRLHTFERERGYNYADPKLPRNCK